MHQLLEDETLSAGGYGFHCRWAKYSFNLVKLGDIRNFALLPISFGIFHGSSFLWYCRPIIINECRLFLGMVNLLDFTGTSESFGGTVHEIPHLEVRVVVFYQSSRERTMECFPWCWCSPVHEKKDILMRTPRYIFHRK